MLDRVWFPNCSTSPAERGQGEQSRNRGGEDEAKCNGPLTVTSCSTDLGLQTQLSPLESPDLMHSLTAHPIKEESCQGHARDGRAGEPPRPDLCRSSRDTRSAFSSADRAAFAWQPGSRQKTPRPAVPFPW
ncbi:hypothetical protein J1605_011733 [Eschrichtius robustus]|uniref:Uncharacterized protein n=1 Tax=Eschrichtius robustus TaxID=9764 RepID=A0AB34GPU3_ESCRO|nr:hypothetical protein J1605_011733 [Eschrichtius robustus]